MYRDYNTVLGKSKNPVLHNELQHIGEDHRKQHISNDKWQIPQTKPIRIDIQMVTYDRNRYIKRAEHDRT